MSGIFQKSWNGGGEMIQSTKMSTKKVTIAGMLGAFSVMLSMTPIGFIPIPFLGINATTMHIPVIIGAIIGGPFVGTLVGLIFGVSSFLRVGSPFFADPLVSILPRLFIGVMSYYTYKATKHAIPTAIVGTLTNTAGVMSMAYFRGYLPLNVIIGIVTLNGVTEAIVSSVIVYLVMKSLKRYTI